MGLFDRLGGQQQNPQQILQRLQQDPTGMLKQKGLNIPQGMTNPQQIVNHLISSGQIPNARLQQVLQMVGRR
jgi:hypothetical protein